MKRFFSPVSCHWVERDENMPNKENHSAEDVSDEEVSHNGGPEAWRSVGNLVRNKVKNRTWLRLELETACGNCPKPDLYLAIRSYTPRYASPQSGRDILRLSPNLHGMHLRSDSSPFWRQSWYDSILVIVPDAQPYKFSTGLEIQHWTGSEVQKQSKASGLLSK